MSNKDRRTVRHNRRIRNQILAYLLLIVLIFGVGFGAFKAVSLLADKIEDTGNEPAITADNYTDEGEVKESEPITISTPDEVVSSNDAESSNEVSVENAAARTYIDSLSVEEKVASLFVVQLDGFTGVNGTHVCGPTTKGKIDSYRVGGIWLTDSNVTKADDFKAFLTEFNEYYNSKYGDSVWLFAREEGAVNTIGGKDGIPTQASASEIGSSGDNNNAYEAYKNIGTLLNEYGININMGPVCDVATNASGFIGNRSFNSDADICASMVENAVKGQGETSVITCLTAFPGQGEASINPKDGLPTTDKSLEDMRGCEFIPFKAGIDSGAQMIVMSHIMAANASGEAVPCSQSKTMIDILRDELGFTGVILADDVYQKAITSTGTSEEAAVASINSGCDMILISGNFEAVYNAVLEAVNNGTISEERLDEALMHIYSLKFAQ